MSAAAAASRYRGVQVATSSPAQLVVMLYEGLLRFVSEADDALKSDDRGRAGERIGRALAIVEELTATLDPQPYPELAENLFGIYGFCKRRLLEANIERERQHLADVVTVLSPLREAWATVAAGR
jgi:flagellar protein FliS